MQSAMGRMRTLIELLNDAAKAYYLGKTPLLTDYEWDALFVELADLEAQSGLVLTGSPTMYSVKVPFLQGDKNHEYPISTLSRAGDADAVVSLLGGRDCVMSWKFDGLPLIVTYDLGSLTSIVTRGNGYSGKDITYLADCISNVPKGIDYQGHIVIHGVCTVSYDAYSAFSLDHGYFYDSPRNLAAGTCNFGKSSSKLKKRGLIWFPFSVAYMNESISSWHDRLRYLENLGFSVIPYVFMKKADNPKMLQHVIDDWSDTVRSVKYPVSGFVFMADVFDFAKFYSGDMKDYGCVLRWKTEVVETKFLSMRWSSSPGSLSPDAIFSPVKLDDKLINRASVYNLSNYEKLGFTGKTASVALVESNKRVPFIVRVRNSKFGFKSGINVPLKCPVCNSSTEISTGENGSRFVRCVNADCPSKQLNKLFQFVSKDGFNISGLTEDILVALVDNGVVSDGVDILTLPDRPDDALDVLMLILDQDKDMVASLFDEIESAKVNVSVSSFLHALAIPGCNKTLMNKVESLYDLDSLLLLMKNYDKITIVNELGVKRGLAFYEWFMSQSHVSYVEKLMRLCDFQNVHSESTSLAGLSFCISGSLVRYESKVALKNDIESRGGRVVGRVSNKVSCLINNDAMLKSPENRAARSLGVPILSEDDFVKEFLCK